MTQTRQIERLTWENASPVTGSGFRQVQTAFTRLKGPKYGLVSMMRDPQMNANKWLSQALHIMNSTAKGGILAERGAFKNISEAQKTYSNPQAITIVEDGAIQKGRIMQKPGAGLAAPYVQLTQLAVDAIPRVTGIPIELMGLSAVNQPGILEAQTVVPFRQDHRNLILGSFREPIVL